MSGANGVPAKMRKQLFVSHAHTDKAVAIGLKKLFEVILPKKVDVFVSSDEVSLAPGTAWFDETLQHLRTSQFLILLLSPESVHRTWLHFEAGFGLALGIKVIPVAIRNLDPSTIRFPLSQFQIRSLVTDDSVHALLEYVSGEEKFGTWPERKEGDSFWQNILVGGSLYTIALANIRDFVKAHCKPQA